MKWMKNKNELIVFYRSNYIFEFSNILTNAVYLNMYDKHMQNFHSPISH